ncbi:c-type cytochrome domain-containing protein [Snuella lapsa]|uniref:Ribonuclease inhibitor n=1 Tax=Snuella lapsa TaxID=870481 RepID=A0ABP6WXH4_9FLAO
MELYNLIIGSVAEDPSDILIFFGRIHPLVVHFPIGFLLLAALVELSLKKQHFQILKNYTHYLWGLGALSSLVAILFGYFLSLSGDYNENTVFLHKWSGIALFVFSAICYYASKKQVRLPFYGKKVLIAVIVLTVFYTGHLGGNLTHGATYLLEYAPNAIRSLAGMPKKAIPRKKVTVLDSADVYLDLVSPIMVNKCVSCHNNDKKKGALDLTTFEKLMQGGENGDVIVPGDVEASDFYRRITLSESHDDFMPAEGKRPLTENEIALIGWWIENNVPSKGYFTQMTPDDDIVGRAKAYLGLDVNLLFKEKVNPPKKKVIDSLSNQGFVLTKLMKDNYYLEANFSLSEKPISEASLETLIQLKEQLIWLNMSHSGIKDEHLEKIGQLHKLIKLNLSRNHITDQGLVQLSNLQNLESLNLYATKVSDSLLVVIPKFTKLNRLYLSSSNANSKIIEQLQKGNESLTIVFD